MITGIGNPVFDLIETPYLKTEGRVLSGCSTNACLALSKLGRETMLVGRVGNDFDEMFRHDMQRFGIRYAVEESEESGGFKLIYYDKHGNRTLDVLGDAGKIDFFPESAADSDWILLGPILQEIDLSYVEMVKERSGAKIFTDPQGFLRRVENGRIVHENTDEIKKIAALSDIFKPNEMECKVLTGIDPRDDYETPARMLKEWGAGVVIITLAEEGSVINDGNEIYRVPAYATTAKDSTGAGDTYAAGMIYALDEGYDYFQAGCFAGCVSAIMIENCGPDFPLTVEEAEARKEKLIHKVKAASS
jgi:sugar/nucleoside kinase (ribokinase family)